MSKNITPIEVVSNCFGIALKIVQKEAAVDIKDGHDLIEMRASALIAASNLTMILASYELETKSLQNSNNPPNFDE